MASMFEDQRDVAALVLPRAGRVEPAKGVIPWVVIDADGSVVEAIARFLQEFVAQGNRPGSVRSYAYVRSGRACLRQEPRRWRCSTTPRGLRRHEPRSTADTRCLPAPTAAHGATASPAVRRPCRCLDATHARTRRTGSGGSSPATWWDANRAARAPAAGPRCRGVRPRNRNGGTIHPPTRRARRPGRPAPHDLARAAARSLQDPARPSV